MGDGMSLNNLSWMGYNPDPMRTIGSNNWQWNMFGTYPNDSLSANNDYNQFKFDFNTSIFLDDTARMSAMMAPMVKMLQASIAEWSQKSLMNISGDYPDLTIRDRRTKSDKTDGKDGKSDKIDGTKVIKEDQINNALNAMGVKDSRMGSKEITYIDKNGKEQKTKLLQRLIQLSKDYQDNPDNPEKIEISESNYKLLWDIAGKYAKTGELSREDYATLIDIAINPGGPGAYKKGGKEEKTEGEDGRPKKNLAVLKNADVQGTGYKYIAQQYKTILYDGNGDGKKLGEPRMKTDKNNIVEVANYFYDAYGQDAAGGDENLVDAIFADCSRWGEAQGVFINRLADNAKPAVTKVTSALIERARDLAKSGKCDEDTAKALEGKCVVLDEAVKNPKYSWWTYNTTDEFRESVSTGFQDLLDTVTNLEKQAYGEYEPEETETAAN